VTRQRLTALAVAVAAALAAGVLSAPAPGSPPAPPSRPGAGWFQLQPSLLPRQESKGVRIGDRIYTYGGFVDGWYPSRDLERYDIRRNRWSLATPAPRSLSHMGAVVHRGKLYVVDGYIGDYETLRRSRGVTVAILLEYDPARDKWTELPRPPTRRGAMVAGVIGNKLYVAGGFTSPQKDLALLEIYDFRTGRWHRGPDMHVARDHSAGAVVDGKFYVIGGRPLSLYGDLGDTERYDPATRRWERVADLPLPRSSISAAVVGKRIVVFGGEHGQIVNGEVDMLDTRTGRWSTLPDMGVPREATAAASYGRRVFAMEGTPQAHLGFSNSVEAIDLPRESPPADRVPRLRLTARPRRVEAGSRVRLRLRVTARTGGRSLTVAGVRVRFAGRAIRTNQRGRAMLRFRPRRTGRRLARATKRGFRPGVAYVRVVEPAGRRTDGPGQRR
jgi:N-acetylneuraminic acid mutarotase